MDVLDILDVDSPRGQCRAWSPPGSRGDTWRSHESESQKMDAQTILHILQVEVSLSQGFGTGIVLVHTGSIHILSLLWQTTKQYPRQFLFFGVIQPDSCWMLLVFALPFEAASWIVYTDRMFTCRSLMPWRCRLVSAYNKKMITVTSAYQCLTSHIFPFLVANSMQEKRLFS